MKLINRLIAFVKKDDGQDLIEYSLITGFVACAVVTCVPEVSDSINAVMSKVNSLMILASAS
jgi:Flp pilus assembly pilin Flp